jgi:hypothetical protein
MIFLLKKNSWQTIGLRIDLICQKSRDLKARISHRQDGERKWAGIVNLQTLVMIINSNWGELSFVYFIPDILDILRKTSHLWFLKLLSSLYANKEPKEHDIFIIYLKSLILNCWNSQKSRDLKARISHRQDGERKWAGFVNLQTLVMIIS